MSATPTAESGEPSLWFLRDLLLCCYMARLMAHPHHAVFHPNLCNRYKMNLGVS